MGSAKHNAKAWSGGRYAAFTQRLLDSVLGAPGDTSGEQRRAVLGRAAGAVLTPLSQRERGSGGEDALGRYVDMVARHAYKLTDDDLAALQRAGRVERGRAGAVRRVHVAPEPLLVLNGRPRRGRVAGPQGRAAGRGHAGRLAHRPGRSQSPSRARLS